MQVEIFPVRNTFVGLENQATNHIQNFGKNILNYPSGLFCTKIEIEDYFSTYETLSPNTSVVNLLLGFKNFFINRNYEFYDSLPLSTDDPTILMMNSTVAVFKETMLSDTPLGKKAIAQLCFREKVPDDYLHSFNMIGISADVCFLNEAFSELIEFLMICGINENNLHVVLNKEHALLLEITRKNFQDNQISHLSKNNDKYNVNWQFGTPNLTGIGLTIVAKLDPNSNANANIMSANFIPLGNVIIVNNSRGEKYIDIGFGVECILSYFHKGIILSIPFFKSQIDSILKLSYLKPEKLLTEILGFICLFSESILPGKKRENYIANKIQNKIFYHFLQSRKSEEDIDLLLIKLLEHYSEKEREIISTAFFFLKKQFKLYQASLIKNNQKAKSLVLRLIKKNCDKKEIQGKIWSTYGLPKNIIKEIIMFVSEKLHTVNVQPTCEVMTKWSQFNGSNIEFVKFRQQSCIKADQIARTFLSYFINQNPPLGHKLIQGASVLTKNDPTLLFINSGMAAIKPFFTGEQIPDSPRLCNVQPCIRTNDIDDIGDMHHLSFFHMLGSWSIGDYYKRDAVHLAYNLLINVLGFPKEKLYVTVFGGDSEMNLLADDETANYWREVGFEDDHIVYLPAEDNFWGPAGDTGPCGPCTEIFYDMGDDFAPAYIPGKGETFDTKHRYVEIWNGGVFMQFFKYQDKSIKPLDIKSVDTGSGLERMTMTMNGYDSVYETDLLKPIYEVVSTCMPSLDIPTKRMITDHTRTACYLISEGIMPGVAGREYIVRKLIRKCVSTIIKEKYNLVDVLEKIVPQTVKFLAESYKHFEGNHQAIFDVIQLEAFQYQNIVSNGIQLVNKFKPEKGSEFSPEKAISLVTAHGLPFEILMDCLQKEGLTLDKEAYLKLETHHRSVSKKNKDSGSTSNFSEEVVDYLKGITSTSFVGYQADKADSAVQVLIQNGLIVEEINNNQPFQFIVATTPFYAEGGGQCGDKGSATTLSGCSIEIMDTQSYGHLTMHQAKIEKGSVKNKEQVSLVVDSNHRAGVKRNHSGTHLLHYALCQVLGSKALQQGSLVEPTRLRFDFKASNPLSQDEIRQIEGIVYKQIIQNHKIEISTVPYQEAKELGAIGMFGEKYGDTVRVIKMGSSKELCGGSHAAYTGDLGLLLIESEKSIAKGIRRIVAVTGPEALDLVWHRSKLLNDITKVLGVKDNELVNHIEKLNSRKDKKADSNKIDFLELKPYEIKQKDIKIRLIQLKDSLDRKQLLDFGKKFLDDSFASVLIVSKSPKGISLNCIKKEDAEIINCLEIIQNLVKSYNGKGGGNEFYANGTLPLANMDEFLQSFLHHEIEI